MILIEIKYQPDGRNFTEIIIKSSCHTHLKNSNPYIFNLHNVNNPPGVFCTRLLFVSAIILIFGGIFTQAPQATKSKAQLDKGANNLILKKNEKQEG